MKASKNIEEHPNPRVKEVASDLDTAKALWIVGDSEGGKVLLKGLVSDIVSAVDTFANKGSSLTMQEMVSLSARIKERIDIARALGRSKKNKEFLEQILEEELKKEE